MLTCPSLVPHEISKHWNPPPPLLWVTLKYRDRSQPCLFCFNCRYHLLAMRCPVSRCHHYSTTVLSSAEKCFFRQQVAKVASGLLLALQTQTTIRRRNVKVIFHIGSSQLTLNLRSGIDMKSLSLGPWCPWCGMPLDQLFEVQREQLASNRHLQLVERVLIGPPNEKNHIAKRVTEAVSNVAGTRA